MKNADMPAMPISEEETDRIDEGVNIYTGLTKREEFAKHFAAAYLTGCLASQFGPTPTSEECAQEAVAYADALLAELGRTQ